MYDQYAASILIKQICGRLIPLAILGICEATGTWEGLSQRMHDTASRFPRYSDSCSRVLHERLDTDLAFLRQAQNSAASSPSAAMGLASFQEMANKVTSNADKYLGKLQQAFESAIGGYDEQQTGKCLYFFAGPDVGVSEVDHHVEDDTDSESTHSLAQKRQAPAAKWRPTAAIVLAVASIVVGITLGPVTNKKCLSMRK